LQAGSAAQTPGGFGAQPDYRPAPSSNSAVNTLLAQADDARQQGDLDAAIAAAERALRIAPADPAVYYQLAVLRMQRGDLALADQLARKGLSYQPDPGLQLRLQEIIERARRGITG
jgi:tetratricopeptide (TPR) repeat protein